MPRTPETYYTITIVDYRTADSYLVRYGRNTPRARKMMLTVSADFALAKRFETYEQAVHYVSRLTAVLDQNNLETEIVEHQMVMI